MPAKRSRRSVKFPWREMTLHQNGSTVVVCAQWITVQLMLCEMVSIGSTAQSTKYAVIMDALINYRREESALGTGVQKKIFLIVYT